MCSGCCCCVHMILAMYFCVSCSCRCAVVCSPASMVRASRLVPGAAPKMTASAFLCVLSRASFQVGARFPRTGAAYSRSGLMHAVYTVLSTLMLALALGVVISLRALRRWRHLVSVYSAWGANVILGSRMIPRYLYRLTHSSGWSLM